MTLHLQEKAPNREFCLFTESPQYTVRAEMSSHLPSPGVPNLMSDCFQGSLLGMLLFHLVELHLTGGDEFKQQ